MSPRLLAAVKLFVLTFAGAALARAAFYYAYELPRAPGMGPLDAGDFAPGLVAALVLAAGAATSARRR